MGFDVETRVRNVTAVLGPTNTGKTHLAIERMLGHETGMIGLPLRLLAREVYDRIVARVGADKVALITGEEKIRPDSPRFWVSTVEAMPREVSVDFLAIDEIQLASDPERGHVFTDRMLHARGKLETLLLGAQTMRDAITDLVDGANFITRPRLSKLTYAGQKKITRLPARSAVVAFSASEVYSIAELIRRQQGGAAVVLGAMSPRTRNAQVELYQSGDVDYLVATDAIGMGLNLDVNHVSFAATRKFDGHQHRQLTPGELAQIAGRAGRYMNDGTFGVTGNVEPFDPDVIDRLETHTFDPVKHLQWRARDLDFATLAALHESLRQFPRHPRLQRARAADDVEALEAVSADREIADMATGGAAVATLWEVCQVPDYRKISSQNHAELVATLYRYLMRGEQVIPEDWFAKQVEFADRTDGDIDTLANRIAHIRTWTFVSNRPNWLKDPAHWQGRTREIEDSLSDALHTCLTQRFVDRRTSALMKGLRAKEELSADIGEDGAIHVESHYVGRLKGFRFIPDAQGEGIHGKATRSAAAQVLAKELAMRVRRVVSARNDAFKASRNGRILWRDQEIARLEPSEDVLKPQISVICDEHLQAVDKDKVLERLTLWLSETVAEKLQPLVELSKAEDITGLAKGIAFRLVENAGSLRREEVAEEIRSLDQEARSQLRKYGVRFGAFNVYFPTLLKPAAAELTQTLWALKNAAAHGLDLENLPEPPRPGLTSVAAVAGTPDAFYRACGYHLCEPRAVRMDILERLADLIRPLVGWRRPDGTDATPPRGSSGDGGFVVIPEMLSIMGCSAEELGLLLKTLGFRLERRPKRQAAPPDKSAATASGRPDRTTIASADMASEPAAEAISVTAQPIAGAVETVPDAEDAAAVPSTTSGDAADVAAEPAGQAMPSAEAAPAATSVVPPDPQAASQDAEAGTLAASAQTEEAGPEVPQPEKAEPAPAQPEASQPAASEAAAGETAATEPEMEEVWRPRRRRERGHGEERGRNRGRNNRRPHERGRNQPNTQPGMQAGSHGGAQMGAPSGTTEQQADGGAQTPAATGQQRRDGEHRDQRNRGFDKKRQHGGEGGGRDRQGRQRQGQQQHGGNRRDERRGNQPQQGQGAGGNRQPGKHGGGKPQRQTVDPDSPFAKLSALKLELEKRAQEQSSS